MKSFKQFIAEDQSDVLYHGTNIHAAVSILQSGQLRATNSRSRYHDGVRGISLTRSFSRACQYGVVFEFHRTNLIGLNVKPHVNKYTERFYSNGEQEEKIFDVPFINVHKYVSGFEIQDEITETKGKKMRPAVDFLVAHPLYRGTY